MENPSFYGRGKILSDLLIKTQLSVNATFAELPEGNSLELGAAVIVEAAENGGYTASKAPANEANGILLETINEAGNEVGILLAGEIKESFYEDAPLNKELRTSLLQNKIVLR